MLISVTTQQHCGLDFCFARRHNSTHLWIPMCCIILNVLFFWIGIVDCIFVSSLSDDWICTPGNEVKEGIQENSRAGRQTLSKEWSLIDHHKASMTACSQCPLSSVCCYQILVYFHHLDVYHVLTKCRGRSRCGVDPAANATSLQHKHTQSLTLYWLFFFPFTLSVSFAVTHPSTDTYFHNSDFYTPLLVTANSWGVKFLFIFFTEVASASVRVGFGVSSR